MVLSLALGLVVGIIMGLTGAGGGILAVPLLVFGLQMSVAQAGPIGLLAVGISAGLGALIGLKKNLVRYRAALLIAGTGIVLAPLGVWLAQVLNTKILSVLFAAVLAWVAHKTFKQARAAQNGAQQNRLAPPCLRDAEKGRFVWTSKCAQVLALSGAIAGFLSGLLGVGGGFVMVPALQRYTDLTTRSVVATSLAVIALVSLAGVGTSIAAGQLDMAVALPFAAGGAVGMGVGTKLSSRLSQKNLKLSFAAICAAVSVGMIVKSLGT
ncbi:MAG: sulfite exporter TauE/SafE family protein [Bdellovibrionales bacterium]|nr:sulfite exporter TauE/SafE family protein [Massilia sp.]